MRTELKTPLGELIRGEPVDTVKKLSEILAKKPPFFAVVGDFVAKNVLSSDLKPDLIVYDKRTLRMKVDPIKHDLPEIYVKNNPGTIDAEAWLALRGSVILKRRIAIVVEGEEDLLVLPLLAEMPLGSVIAYGQPYEGLVVVTVTEKKRDWARSFLKRMEEIE